MIAAGVFTLAAIYSWAESDRNMASPATSAAGAMYSVLGVSCFVLAFLCAFGVVA